MNEIESAYQAALDYLYSFIDYSLTRQLRYSPEKFNLDRMVALLDLLGNPQRQYPIIHVAGTKGKGSTAALCASALQAAGLKTGLYTSPHLSEYTERVQVDGVEVSKAALVMLLNEMKPVIEQVPQLTTFEITTALGFLHFARQGVDAAVVEVGLGGRLDATNVVEPLLAVITSISIDHMAVLGNTLAEIAGEKAGIIKPGRPVVVATQTDEALQAITRIATERGAPLTLVGRDVHFKALSRSLDGQSLQVWAEGQPPLELFTPLLGLHQVENAATAYAALRVARASGLPVPDEAIRAGFERVVWHARFEVLRREPPVIIDSAHNRDSALRLRQALDDYLPGRRVVLLFGASEDKDISGMFAELLPRVSKLITTQSVHPRAADAEALARLARPYDVPARAVLPIEQALQAALEIAEKEQSALVVAGSLFVAAAARDVWTHIHQS